MFRNLPSLFSLELVGSSKNVAKSTSWPQVQKAVYLWGIVRKIVKDGLYQNRGDYTDTTHLSILIWWRLRLYVYFTNSQAVL